MIERRDILLGCRAVLAVVVVGHSATRAFGQEMNPAALSNPAVRAAMELPRDEPADYVRAINNLLDLGEGELAAGVFAELAELELDDDARAELVEQRGPAALLRLSRQDGLGQEADTFVSACLAAAHDRATAPERIEQLIDSLGEENAGRRRVAVAQLAGVGTPAVAPLLSRLAGEELSDTHRQGIRSALVKLGPLAEGPLLAALRSDSEHLQGEAATLLARLQSPQAAPLLALPAVRSQRDSAVDDAYVSLTGQPPSIESATGLLSRTLDRLESGGPIASPDAEGNIRHWIWSAEQDAPQAVELPAADAATVYRAHLATDLAVLQPEDDRAQSLALRLPREANRVLQLAGAPALFDAPALAELEAENLNRVLGDALAADQSAAAVATLQEIARRQDPELLVTSDGRPSPTARALRHPHPNVRSAAVEAVAEIDSPRPFPGASRLRSAAVQLAAAAGRREVLAGAPQVDTAASWAGGLAALGYDGQVANSGNELLEVARTRADVELVLIDMAIGSPAVREVVYRLRRDAATALVPIGLLARESQLGTARQIASQHDAVLAFPRPHDQAALEDVARMLAERQVRDWPTADERLAQARQATAAINRLLTADRSFYRLRAASDRLARVVHPTSDDSPTWHLLSNLGTRDSQLAILGYTNAPALDVAVRQAAVEALAASVQQFGLLLTTEEIHRQYDLYNASADQPAATQQVLGQVLDIIEGKALAADQSIP